MDCVLERFFEFILMHAESYSFRCRKYTLVHGNFPRQKIAYEQINSCEPSWPISIFFARFHYLVFEWMVQNILSTVFSSRILERIGYFGGDNMNRFQYKNKSQVISNLFLDVPIFFPVRRLTLNSMSQWIAFVVLHDSCHLKHAKQFYNGIDSSLLFQSIPPQSMWFHFLTVSWRW